MPVANSSRARVACRYLSEQEADPTQGETSATCFVTLDLITGVLSVNSTKEFAGSLPWRVAVCWTLRWPVAALPADRANKLLDEITPHAQRLIDATSTELPDQQRPGTVLNYGAGLGLDAIQRRCAATWTDPDRLHREQ